MATFNEALIRAQSLLGGGLAPLGIQAITDVSSATGLTIPNGSAIAILNPTGANVRWRDDGTSPDASTGMQIVAGQYFTYTGDLDVIEAIEETGTATLTVSYFGGP